MLCWEISCPSNNIIVIFSSCGWANSCFSLSHLRSYGFLCFSSSARKITQPFLTEYNKWSSGNLFHVRKRMPMTSLLFDSWSIGFYSNHFIIINSIHFEMVFINVFHSEREMYVPVLCGLPTFFALQCYFMTSQCVAWVRF